MGAEVRRDLRHRQHVRLPEFRHEVVSEPVEGADRLVTSPPHLLLRQFALLRECSLLRRHDLTLALHQFCLAAEDPPLQHEHYEREPAEDDVGPRGHEGKYRR